MRGLRMTFDLWLAFQCQGIPDDGPGGLVEGEKAPTLIFFLIDRLDIAVESDFEFGVPSSVGRLNVGTIAPDDWRRMSETGNRGFPSDISIVFDVPSGWGCETGGDATRLLASELRPVMLSCGEEGADCQQTEREEPGLHVSHAADSVKDPQIKS